MKTRNDSQLSFDDKTFLGKSYYNILVPEDHFLRRVNNLIDFSHVKHICAPEYKQFGRPPEDPERMFRMLLVMFLYQIKHETELTRQIQVNMAYKWFCGFKITESLPDHSLFYVFRKRLGPKIFEKIFAEIIHQCIDKKLLTRERIYIDSTDIKDAATDYTPYEQAHVLARAMIKKLEQVSSEETESSYQPPKRLDEQSKRLVAEAAIEFTKAKRVNTEKFMEKIKATEDNHWSSAQGGSKDTPQTHSVKLSKNRLRKIAKETFSEVPHAQGDKDSRVGHTSDRKSFTGYLATISVGDEQETFITGIEVTPGNSYAAKNFKSVYQQHKEHTQQIPHEVTGDSAFDQAEVHTTLSRDRATGYIKQRRFTTNSKVFSPDEFTFAEDGTLMCPRNKTMKLIGITSDHHIYQGTECLSCPLGSQCTTSEDGIRRVKINLQARQRRQHLKEINTTQEFKDAQKRRLRIEGIIGHAKTSHLLGQAIYRSLPMQKIQGFLSAIAVNIEKLVKALLKCPRDTLQQYSKERLVPT